MGDDRIIQAIGRLERALARIETLDASGETAAADMVPRAEHEQLAARLGRLRAGAAAALDGLDRLIAEREG